MDFHFHGLELYLIIKSRFIATTGGAFSESAFTPRAGKGMNYDKSNNPNTLSLSYADRLWQSWQEDPASVPGLAGLVRRPGGCRARATPAYRLSGADQRPASWPTRTRSISSSAISGCGGTGRPAWIPWASPGESPPELTLEYYGFGEEDLDRIFSAGTLSPGDMLPLREILRKLQATYARFIGVQYMHIDDLKVREWLQTRMEAGGKPYRSAPRGAGTHSAAVDRRRDLRGIHPEQVSRVPNGSVWRAPRP